MARRVVWTRPARLDLEHIIAYVTEHSSAQRAAALAKTIMQSTRHLADFPRSGKVAMEHEGKEIREVASPPFRVLYREQQNETVEILSVIHGRRNLP